MSSALTVRPISGADYYGRSVEDWKRIAQNAHTALSANSHDAGARLTFQSAQGVLREHVANLAQRNDAANQRDTYSAAEYADANQVGMGQSFAANALDAASLGMGDEIAGVGAMLPGGMTPQQARDRYRAGLNQTVSDAPLSALAGQVAGATGIGVAAGQLPFLNGLSRTVAAGAKLGGPIIRSALAAGAIGGGEGVVRGVSSQGDIGQRLENAGTYGAVGAGMAGLGTAAINTGMQGLGAVKAAK
jgi:hypothetical protein